MKISSIFVSKQAQHELQIDARDAKQAIRSAY